MATILGFPIPGTTRPAPQVITAEGQRGAISELDEIGATGTSSYSGFLSDEDYNNDLKWPASIQVYDRMLNDPMIAAIVRSIVLPIRGATIKVDPASDEDQDVHIAHAVKHALTHMPMQTWKQFVRQAVRGMLGYGHAAFEPVWAGQDGKPCVVSCDGEDILVPYKLAPRLQKTIYRWLIDRSGELRGIVQKTFVSSMEPGQEVAAARNDPAGYVTAGTVQFPVIPVERLALFVLDREGANYAGVSMLRTAYRPWYDKDKLLRIAAVSAERHGVGVPYIITKAGIKKAEETAAVNAIRTVRAHEKAYISISAAHIADARETGMPGVGILDMKSSALRSTDNLIQYQDRQIALSVLADFLTLGSGIGGNANVMHRDKSSLFFNSMRALVDDFEEPANRQIVQRIVDVNWPGHGKYPTLRLTSLETRDFEKLGRSLALMATAGLITPTAELQNELLEMMDFAPLPEDADGNPILPEPPTPPPAPNAPPSGEGMTPEVKPKVGMYAEWHRPLRLAEKHVDFSAIDDALTKGVQELRDVGAEPVQAIAAAVRNGRGTKRLEARLASALQPVLRSLQEFGADQVFREYDRVRGRRHAEGPPALPSGGLGAIAAAMAEKITGRIRYWFEHFDGEPTADDWLTAQDSALGVVARYSVTTPLNEGRDQAASELKDEIAYAERSALLDKETCDPCSSLDGEQYELDSAEYDDNEPPSHCDGGDNCRCVYVYVFADEARQMSVNERTFERIVRKLAEPAPSAQPKTRRKRVVRDDQGEIAEIIEELA